MLIGEGESMKKQIIGAAAVFLLSALVIAFCFAFVIQAATKDFSLCDDAAFMAAAFSFSNGSLFKTEETEPQSVAPVKKSEAAVVEAPTQNPKKTAHDGEAYPVLETNISEGNMRFENISIKNTTVYSPDIESLLSMALPFEIEDSRQVQVLIYHTRTCESYRLYGRVYNLSVIHTVVRVVAGESRAVKGHVFREVRAADAPVHRGALLGSAAELDLLREGCHSENGARCRFCCRLDVVVVVDRYPEVRLSAVFEDRSV